METQYAPKDLEHEKVGVHLGYGGFGPLPGQARTWPARWIRDDREFVNVPSLSDFVLDRSAACVPPSPASMSAGRCRRAPNSNVAMGLPEEEDAATSACAASPRCRLVSGVDFG